jgi:AcrR family transcriptional regulator
MPSKTRLAPEETRERILDVAEEHFRRIGYAKTAVADLAAALDMSPANIYRFFPSKSAINEAICRRLLDESEDIARKIAYGPEPAAEKLAILALEMHRFTKSRCTDERRLHDMVEVAMQENWSAIEAHMAEIIAVFAHVIGEGMARGEFRQGDAVAAATIIKQALTVVLHPTLIAQCSHLDLEHETKRLSQFLIKALQ